MFAPPPLLPDDAMRHGEAEPPAAIGTPLGQLGARLRSTGFAWFFADLAQLPADLQASTPDEIAQAARLPAGIIREGWLARRRLARQVVAEALETSPDALRIEADALGRPLLKGAGEHLHLSFSARDTLALIGIADGPLGVDLEIETPDLALPLKILRPDEQAWLTTLPEALRIHAFLRIWAAKEAIVKMLGQGFRIAPERIALPSPATGLVDIRILPGSAVAQSEISTLADRLILTREGIRVFVSPATGEERMGSRSVSVALARVRKPSSANPDQR